MSSCRKGRLVICDSSVPYFQQRMDSIVAASRQDLALCPGLGPQKVITELV